MALRCVSVIRGISNPFVVDLISNNDDEFGVVVPIPAAPLEGNILVCAVEFFEDKMINNKIEIVNLKK